MTMTLSPEQEARAREYESLILQRVSSIGQKTIADATDLSISTISRWGDGEYARWCKVLALLGLQVVPDDARCHPADYIDSLRALAKRCLDHESKRPGPLGWD
ncbi:CII family transcriptional regulator [Azotobacter chroococcum]|uniref:Bacteriophage CII protein n=1 Tax=Azotobacter chroococcum TaxID=353 RepID=A0A4R1PR78_9GAMM|nr:CII family transcriptional regulator [Azotobacter chroococcum]TBV95938.1 transcriptional regulator [Azotobacter chroococcum]TCL26847.1 bacteriophage CII protein [Azotobacter chroococcum]